MTTHGDQRLKPQEREKENGAATKKKPRRSRSKEVAVTYCKNHHSKNETMKE
jgi:hypothetical protein